MGDKHKLLIIEDEPEICELLREAGELSGYEVTITSTAEEFYSAFVQHTPTFIIIDLNIPDHDGIELMRFLSQNKCTCPVILISGQDEKVLAVSTKLGQTMNLNMWHYLSKPIKMDDIVSLLKKGTEKPSAYSVDSLRKAIDEELFTLHYQPKISIKDGKILGLEALMRLEVHEGKIIDPDIFIPLAEETDLIRALSQFTIKKAFFEFKKLLDLGYDFSLSINLSPKILNDLLMPDIVVTLAKEAKIDTKKICLEVTETAFVKQKSTIADVLTRFRIKGFILSIDDFGTGYASLIELHNLPFNEIKIDKSFVLEIESDQEALHITQSVINLGHELGLVVTAEGVETKEAWDILKAQGCDIAQGFYISPPLSFEKVKEWLAAHKDGSWSAD